MFFVYNYLYFCAYKKYRYSFLNNHFMKYDLSKGQSLIQSVKSVTTFSEVKNWDKQASEEINAISIFLQNIPLELESLENELSKSRKSFSTLPFFKRLFSIDKRSNDIQNDILAYSEVKPMLQKLQDELQYWIEMTPDDAQEAKAMLNELKLAKKELTAQKKEARAEIKQVNANARAKNTQISGQYFFSSPKLRKGQKQWVREQKESAVSSYEGIILSIDKQMIDIDRMIIWIDRIRFE